MPPWSCWSSRPGWTCFGNSRRPRGSACPLGRRGRRSDAAGGPRLPTARTARPAPWPGDWTSRSTRPARSSPAGNSIEGRRVGRVKRVPPARRRKMVGLVSLGPPYSLRSLPHRRAGRDGGRTCRIAGPARPLAKAVPAKPLGRALAVLAALAAAIGLLAWPCPDWSRPSGIDSRGRMADVPPYSPLRFTVAPGDPRALRRGLGDRRYGRGRRADHLELVLESGDGSQSSLPMFSETSGAWRAVLSKLTEPTDYFVRCYRARSQKYPLRSSPCRGSRVSACRSCSRSTPTNPATKAPCPTKGSRGSAAAR